MKRSQLILPCADAGCGKVFYHDRRAADQHRIALGLLEPSDGSHSPRLSLGRLPLQAVRWLPYWSETDQGTACSYRS